MNSWLRISRCLRLDEWSHSHDSLCHEDLFIYIYIYIVLLCLLATSFRYLLLLLGPDHFCPLLSPSLHEMFLGISDFLEKISSLPHCIAFLYFFALFTYEGFLALLWNSAFRCIYLSFSPLPFTSLLFFSQLFVRPEREPFCFFAFFFLGIVLVTTFYTMLWTSVHSCSAALSDLIPWFVTSSV